MKQVPKYLLIGDSSLYCKGGWVRRLKDVIDERPTTSFHSEKSLDSPGETSKL